MNPLYQRKVALQFKGNRKYVQGADIYDAVIEIGHDFLGIYPQFVKGSFYNFLESNGLFSIYDDIKTIEQENCVASFSIYVNQSKYELLVEADENKISKSTVYNENDILKGMNIDNKIARIIGKSSYSYMEQIVAITKKLHFMVYPNADGKWLFTKIEIKDIIDPALFRGHTISVEAKKNFHYKLTQNTIFLDEKYLGFIWYSLQK